MWVLWEKLSANDHSILKLFFNLFFLLHLRSPAACPQRGSLRTNLGWKPVSKGVGADS